MDKVEYVLCILPKSFKWIKWCGKFLVNPAYEEEFKGLFFAGMLIEGIKLSLST